MSVPDHQLDPEEDETVWCQACLKMHSPADCEYWNDWFVQQKFDHMRESSP